MQRSKSKKQSHTTQNGTHTTKSSAKSNRGGANSAQQIVNINLGDLVKKSKPSSSEIGFVGADEMRPEPQMPLFEKEGRRLKEQKTVQAPLKKRKISQKLPVDTPTQPTANVRQFRETINEYVRTIENLSPALRTPDIADVPDNLLTPSTPSEMQQTMQWLKQAIATAKQRMRTTILPQNQIQPGFQTFVPLDQQLRISQLQQALAEAEKRLQDKKDNKDDKGSQTNQNRPLPLPKGPLAVGVGVQDREQSLLTAEGIAQREREIENLKLNIITSREVTEEQKREIEKLKLELQEAKRLNPDNQNVREIQAELDFISQEALRIQANFDQGGIVTQAFLSPESVGTSEAQQEIYDEMQDDKLRVANQILSAKNQEDLDRAKAEIQKVVTKFEYAINNTPALTSEQIDEIIRNNNQNLEELKVAWEKRKKDIMTPLEAPAGRADTEGSRQSLRAFEGKLRSLIAEYELTNQTFYNAPSDASRYTAWLNVRNRREMLYEATQNPLFNRVSPNLRNQVEISLQRINRAEGREKNIQENDFVLILPPQTSNLPPDTVGQVVRVENPDGPITGTQLLLVRIPGVPEAVPIQRQNLYPAISGQMTQTPSSSPGQLAGAVTPFGSGFGSPLPPVPPNMTSPFSPFQSIPTDLYGTPLQPTQTLPGATATPGQATFGQQVREPTAPGTSSNRPY